MKIKAISASETAFILRRALGAVRHWDDALADMRRGKTSYHGLTLLPFCRCHDGKAYRPYYRLADIKHFIKAALTVAPSSTALAPIQVREIEVDPTDMRQWQHRRLV